MILNTAIRTVQGSKPFKCVASRCEVLLAASPPLPPLVFPLSFWFFVQFWQSSTSVHRPRYRSWKIYARMLLKFPTKVKMRIANRSSSFNARSTALVPSGSPPPIPFFILFLCLFLSLWPFQLYFSPCIFPTTLRLLTLFFRS